MNDLNVPGFKVHLLFLYRAKTLTTDHTVIRDPRTARQGIRLLLRIREEIPDKKGPFVLLYAHYP
jgi:hypothetical protein